MNPLQMASTDDLWDELAKRQRSCIFVYEKEMPGQVNSPIVTNVWWKGTTVSAVGLINYAERYLDMAITLSFQDQFNSE